MSLAFLVVRVGDRPLRRCLAYLQWAKGKQRDASLGLKWRKMIKPDSDGLCYEGTIRQGYRPYKITIGKERVGL